MQGHGVDGCVLVSSAGAASDAAVASHAHVAAPFPVASFAFSAAAFAATFVATFVATPLTFASTIPICIAAVFALTLSSLPRCTVAALAAFPDPATDLSSPRTSSYPTVVAKCLFLA